MSWPRATVNFPANFDGKKSLCVKPGDAVSATLYEVIDDFVKVGIHDVFTPEECVVKGLKRNEWIVTLPITDVRRFNWEAMEHFNIDPNKYHCVGTGYGADVKEKMIEERRSKFSNCSPGVGNRKDDV